MGGFVHISPRQSAAFLKIGTGTTSLEAQRPRLPTADAADWLGNQGPTDCAAWPKDFFLIINLKNLRNKNWLELPISVCAR